MAFVRPRPSLELEELFSSSVKRGIWLALDCLQDPHNVGAIFRAAAFFGVQGIVLTEDRSAPLSSVVYDVASGGMEAVPFSVQTNLRRSLDVAKKHDLWVLGSSEHAKQNVAQIDRDRRWLLVVGNEEKGMRRLTTEHCDELCTIPCASEVVTSLNASVATGILLSHLTQP
jgi:23S rRNA (guanosine2251-2'-O)-methyltransferase